MNSSQTASHTEILTPPDLFNKIESWLYDSLEPKLSGMLMKYVDGMFLVFIPESPHKPHRDQPTKRYYSRNETSSLPMPEVMIAALYRAQSVLSFHPDLHLSRLNRQWTFDLFIANDSMVAGTMPRICATFYAWDVSVNEATTITFKDRGGRLDESGFASWMQPPELPWAIANFSTSKAFREEVLYPRYEIRLPLHSEPFDFPCPRYVAVRIECYFAQAKPQVTYFLFDLEISQRSTMIKQFRDGEEQFLEAAVQKLRS
jgi:hypothetical protein